MKTVSNDVTWWGTSRAAVCFGVVMTLALIMLGCGSGTRTAGDAGSDASFSDASDSGAADSGAADSGAADSGAADSGAADSGAADSGPPAPTCSACTSDAECGSARCVSFPDGAQGCLPTCQVDLPSCEDPGFRCAFDVSVPDTTVCIPFGDGCCVDEDGDGFGQGVSCTATDCDDTSELVHPGASEVCNGADDNCDGVVDEGFDLSTDVSHCGSCDAICAPANASGACGGGTCAVAACAVGFADCDGDPTSGCEVSTTTMTDCGGCGAVCAPAHATGTCATGGCAVASCEVGFADCDGDPTSGCEVSTTTMTDCGGCGAVCAPAHATGTCATGGCAVASCEVGFADCDGDPTNGCEADLSPSCSTNPDTCLAGVLACVGGAATCTDDPGSPRSAGTPCTGGTCDGRGACVACSAGAVCSTNPGPCYDGTVQCGAGAPVCADNLSAPTSAGTPCAGGTCDGRGACASPPVDCVGAWGSCSAACDGTQTFSISTPAANGGAPCAATNGATRSCNTSRRYQCPSGYTWSGLSLDCLSLNSTHTAAEMCCLGGSATVSCVVGSALVSGCTAVATASQVCF